MKNFQKLFVIMLLAILAVAPVFAGGSSEKSSSEASIQDAVKKVLVEKEEVTITFWTGTGTQNYPYLENMVNAFMEKYPNIKVDFSNQGAIGDLTNKVTQNIISKTTPTLTNLYGTTFPEYIASGALVDLMPYFTDSTIGYTEEEASDFFSNYIEECKSFGEEGTMYAWPTNKKTTDVLYYNRTYFEEHNLSVPTTWDEVVEVSKYIYEDTGKPGFSYDTAPGEQAFKTMSSQWGSAYINADGTVDVDNEASLAVLNFYKENMDKGYFTLPALMPSAGGNYSNSGFKMEECYMYIGTASGAQYAVPNPASGQKDFEVGVAPLPQYSSSTAVTFNKGENYAVFTNSTTEQRVAAWLLIKFLSGAEENVEWLTATGNLPISTSQLENEEYQKFLNNSEEGTKAYTYAQAVKAALEMKDITEYDIIFDRASDFASDVGTMWTSVLIGGADARSSLEELQAKYN